MYILNIGRAIKKCHLMNSETLSMKVIKSKSNFMKKAVFIL